MEQPAVDADLSLALADPGQDTPNRRGFMSYVPGPFDYEALAPEIREETRSAAERIKGLHRKAVIETGHELLKVKQSLPHGQFTDWLNREFGFSPTTARNCMRAAAAFGEKPGLVAVLPPGALYVAANAPDEVKAEIERKVEAGGVVDKDEVVDMIRRRKEEVAEAARLEAMTPEARSKQLARKQRQQRDREQQRLQWTADRQREEREASEAADQIISFLKCADMNDQDIEHLCELWSLGGRFVRRRLSAPPSNTSEGHAAAGVLGATARH